VRVVSDATVGTVLGRLEGSPRVVVSGNFATPWQSLKILDGSVASYRLFALNAQAGIPDRDGVTLESPFVGPGMRRSQRLRYLPCRLSLVPSLLSSALVPDVVLVQTSVPERGTVSLGTEVNILPAAIEAARSRGGLVMAQLNRSVPYSYGDAVLATDEIDLAMEADAPLASPTPRDLSDVHRLIGERVGSLVPDGATLQVGIGAVPDAVLGALRDRHDLRVWSEMFSDGVLALAASGALDQESVVTASFAFGSSELYEWIDRNPRVRMLRTEKTNDPSLIARQRAMTSVNGAIHSGFGGQTDFVVGALHSPGGSAIIALPSWHPKADVSTVVPRLAGPVTSFQHSFFVSEQGTATIWGNDAATQAAQIISDVAHPAAREELREAGRALGFGLG